MILCQRLYLGIIEEFGLERAFKGHLIKVCMDDHSCGAAAQESRKQETCRVFEQELGLYSIFFCHLQHLDAN